MRLIKAILDEITETPASDVRVGLKYTAVRIGDRIGLAHTVSDRRETPGDVGLLVGKNLADLAFSWNLTEAAIGTAAINAQLEPRSYQELEVFKFILKRAKSCKSIGVVGHFPFIEHLRGVNDRIFVFEKQVIKGCLPACAEEDLLPRCDLVIISGSAFVNKTLERLLEISNGFTIVIGPTTPLSPVLFDFGADAIAGVLSERPKVLDVVSQGGGTHDFKHMVSDVFMEKGK